MILAVDGGTTNTRVVLIENGVVAEKTKLSVGAGNYGGEREDYIRAVGDAVKKYEDKAEAVVLSGMIGSEKGLTEVTHLTAPAGKAELHGSMMKAYFPEFTSLPLYFIRGVKTEGDISEYDIMRGEETELMGISHLTGVSDGVFLLPGSHNKIVFMRDGKITSFVTAMSGEITRAICEHTILSSGLSGGFSDKPDTEYLTLGYSAAGKIGINGAAFKSRILEKFTGNSDAKQRYSFLLGAVLYSDVSLTLKKAGKNPVTVAGSDPMKSALCLLLENEGVTVKKIPTEISDISASVGAEIIYKGTRSRIFGT